MEDPPAPLPKPPLPTPPVIDDELLALLRCPLDGSKLRLAAPAIIAQLNRSIAEGTLANAADEKVERPLSGGLIREAGDRLYPIVDMIPVMLADEAILLEK